MSKRQVQKMLGLMASGEPVELTSAMASVKKLARLAFIAQQFGYEYMDVRQSGSRNNALVMLIVPDPSPQARARAAQNWAQYPNAGDGVSVPPLVPDAFELLKARINFDLTGKQAEKRMWWGAGGITLGFVIAVAQAGGDADAVFYGGLGWAGLLALLAIGLVVTRKRNAKFAARLQAAGFHPVTDESGRLRYLPPGAQMLGQANPFAAAGPYGNVPAAGPYGTPSPYGAPQQPYAPQQQQPYAPQQQQPYAAPQQQQPYAAPQQQQPYPPQQQPYPPQQQPYPPQSYPQQNPQPNPQQNPHWQPPQH
ncbi:hypothetical protein AB0I00_30245 [Streptomyces sp. NPDC050803]|uniref:hypothetical protein n=1 Tax=unclassified Streptomyces TaxID=2593676 RepID=UPI00343596D9